jgi:hypothetical protein
MESTSTGTSRFSVGSSKPSDVADDQHNILPLNIIGTL